MQSFGIDNTEQIVDTMIEISPEERTIRMEFLNKILLAKKAYKQSIEAAKAKKAKQNLVNNSNNEQKMGGSPPNNNNG